MQHWDSCVTEHCPKRVTLMRKIHLNSPRSSYHTNPGVFYTRSQNIFKPQLQPQEHKTRGCVGMIPVSVPALPHVFQRELLPGNSLAHLPPLVQKSLTHLPWGSHFSTLWSLTRNSVLVSLPGSSTYALSNWTPSPASFPDCSCGYLSLTEWLFPSSVSFALGTCTAYQSHSLDSIMPFFLNRIFWFSSSKPCPLWGREFSSMCWTSGGREWRGSQGHLSNVHWLGRRGVEQMETREISAEHKCFLLWGWSNTGCPGRMCCLHLWRWSKPARTQSWTQGSGWPCHSQGLGRMFCLPASAILWFCEQQARRKLGDN